MTRDHLPKNRLPGARLSKPVHKNIYIDALNINFAHESFRGELIYLQIILVNVFYRSCPLSIDRNNLVRLFDDSDNSLAVGFSQSE